MIKIIRPDENNYLILKYIYDQYKDEMKVTDEFKEICTYNCMFFFEDEAETFIGCIYFYPVDDKTFVNVFASRGHHLLNMYIFKKVLDFYNLPIYARLLQRTSKIGALRCGFKKFQDDIYIYERK